MMEATITVSRADAAKLRAHIDRLKGNKQGPTTTFTLGIFEAVLAALPIQFDEGDLVTVGGTNWTIEQFANGGSMAVVASIDREVWRVFACTDLEPVETVEGTEARVSKEFIDAALKADES